MKKSLLALALFASLPAMAHDPDEQVPPLPPLTAPGTHYGDSISIGNGRYQTYIRNTQNGKPDAIGVLLSRVTVESLPVDPVTDGKSCIDLNNTYQKQYKLTKERLMSMPKGKQFEFSPNQIFGKFDLFCRRIAKLIDLFQTIKQFKTLSQHNLENIDPILKSFDGVQAKLNR